MMAKGRYTVGVDLGGTKIFTLAALPDGREAGSDRRPTLADQGPQAVIGRIIDSVQAALAAAGATMADLAAVAVVSPGPVDQNRLVLTGEVRLPAGNDRMRPVVQLVSLLQADTLFSRGYSSIRLASSQAAEGPGNVTQFVIECR